MKSFLEWHGKSIAGCVSTFDRVIFKGHLNGFSPVVPLVDTCHVGRFCSRRPIVF